MHISPPTTNAINKRLPLLSLSPSAFVIYWTHALSPRCQPCFYHPSRAWCYKMATAAAANNNILLSTKKQLPTLLHCCSICGKKLKFARRSEYLLTCWNCRIVNANSRDCSPIPSSCLLLTFASILPTSEIHWVSCAVCNGAWKRPKEGKKNGKGS